MGTTAASVGAAGDRQIASLTGQCRQVYCLVEMAPSAPSWRPPHQRSGPQDLPRDYGPDGAAGGLSRSTPRQADDATTRPTGAGRHVSPMRGTRSQSLPDYLLRPTRHGPGGTLLIIAHFFLGRSHRLDGLGQAIQRTSLKRQL